MSSPPEPRTLEGLIADSWGDGVVQRADIKRLLEPYREHVEYLLDDFDEASQSWRDYSSCIWGGYGYEGAIPRNVVQAVEALLKEPQVTADEKRGNMLGMSNDTSKKYTLDHSTTVRTMLDLVRVDAEQRAAETRQHIAELQKQSNAVTLPGGARQRDFLVQQIEQQRIRLEQDEAIAKDPERFAVEIGARQLAANICQYRPTPALHRPMPMPIYTSDDLGAVTSTNSTWAG